MQDLPPTDDGLILVPLSIERALLPDWYDEVIRVAHPVCRRVGVIEQTEQWIVQVQLPRERVPAFKEALLAAWDTFVAARKAEGRWTP